MFFKFDNKTESAIWFFKKNLSLVEVSDEENCWAKDLSPLRAKEYLIARGYLRKSLSNLLEMDALNVPLQAPPGKPPLLENGLGFVSISHCKDALILGWSKEKIGLDIEISNRVLNYQLIIEKFFFDNEIKILSEYEINKSNKLALKMWVLKEAAIKWQNGNLYKDLYNWQIKDNLLLNKLTGTKLDYFLINHKSWIIGIVLRKDSNTKNPIICIN